MARTRTLAALGIAALGACALSPATARADVELEVRADRTALGLDETLTLRVAVQAEGMSQPDVSLPDFDGFDIVGQQVQRPMQFSFSFGANTTVRSSTVYTFQLQPTRAGEIVIKPVRVSLDGRVKSSEPLRIVVSGTGGQAPASATPQPGSAAPDAQPPGGGVENTQIDPLAFVRTVVDKTEPYEGEQVTVTIYLYVRDRLASEPAARVEPTTNGLWTHDLFSPARAPRPSRQMVNGAVFTVYPLRRFAAFPLKAGETTIGPLEVDIDTSGPFDIFNPGRANKVLRRAGLPTVLKVKPLPDAGRPPGEIAVGQFEVEAKLDRAQAATGDAVTLTAAVRGRGNVRTAQLALPAIAGIEALAPELKDLVEAPNDRVSGVREYRYLLVARAPGHYTLPPITLHTFDPEKGAYVTKQSAALTLDVVGNAQAAPAASAVAVASTPPSAGGPAMPDLVEPAHVWAPIRTHSALARAHSPLHEHALFPLALLLPELLLLWLVGGALLRRRREARDSTPEGRALREAERHLRDAESAAADDDQARFCTQGSAALLGVLAARLGEPVSGLTHGQLERMLRARGLPEPACKHVIASLSQSDLARFGASAAALPPLREQLAALRALYRELAVFVPKEAA